MDKLEVMAVVEKLKNEAEERFRKADAEGRINDADRYTHYYEALSVVMCELNSLKEKSNG